MTPELERAARAKPGSDEAIDAGCTCPILDNAHGKGWLCSGEFWITEGCPLHAPTAGIDHILGASVSDVQLPRGWFIRDVRKAVDRMRQFEEQFRRSQSHMTDTPSDAAPWYKTRTGHLHFEWINMRYGYGEPLSRPHTATIEHWSDCAVNNAPAFNPGPCDSATQTVERERAPPPAPFDPCPDCGGRLNENGDCMDLQEAMDRYAPAPEQERASAAEPDAPVEKMLANIALDHLANALYAISGMPAHERCRALEDAVIFHNQHRPDCKIEWGDGAAAEPDAEATARRLLAEWQDDARSLDEKLAAAITAERAAARAEIATVCAAVLSRIAELMRSEGLPEAAGDLDREAALWRQGIVGPVSDQPSIPVRQIEVTLPGESLSQQIEDILLGHADRRNEGSLNQRIAAALAAACAAGYAQGAEKMREACAGHFDECGLDGTARVIRTLPLPTLE